MSGYIFQAPTLKRVLDTRTYNASICIQQTLSHVQLLFLSI